MGRGCAKPLGQRPFGIEAEQDPTGVLKVALQIEGDVAGHDFGIAASALEGVVKMVCARATGGTDLSDEPTALVHHGREPRLHLNALRRGGCLS